MTLIDGIPSHSWANNPIWINVEADSAIGLDGVFISVLLEIFCDALPGGSTTANFRVYPDASTNRAIIRVDEYFRNAMQNAILLPPVSTTAPLEASISIASMSITAREYTQDGTQVGSDLVINRAQTFRGGLPWQKYPTVNYWADIHPTKKCLTWQPDGKRVSETSPEFLSVLFQAPSMITIKPKVTIGFTDGTTGTPYLYGTGESAHGLSGYKEIWCIPVSYSALDIAAHSGFLTAAFYDVQLWDVTNGTAISEVRRYVIDRTSYWNPKTFLFINSLSGTDTLLTNGFYKRKVDNSHSVGERFSEVSYSEIQGKRKVLNITEQESIKTSSSFRTSQEVNAYRDMLLSTHVYEYLDGLYLPIEILPGSFMIEDQERALPYLEFEYRYLYDNINFMA